MLVFVLSVLVRYRLRWTNLKLLRRQGESGSQYKVRLLTSKKLFVQRNVEGAGRGMGGWGKTNSPLLLRGRVVQTKQSNNRELKNKAKDDEKKHKRN